MKMKALIIAAGRGIRLQPLTNDIPKPLVKLLGLTLIERVILSLKTAGINEFVIVIGFLKDSLITTLGDGEKVGVRIKYIYNPNWESGNGLSVYVAKEELQNEERFILCMADHIFDLDILKDFIRQPLEDKECLLCVDIGFSTIYNLESATKVKVENNYVVSIGKDIADFNGVDCGLFICSPLIFETLEYSFSQNHMELTDAMRLLAINKKLRAFEIYNKFWIDIDTPGDLRLAERKLLQFVKKNSDGIIAQKFNRNISKIITRLVINTKITSNQITILSFIVGCVSALMFSLKFLFLGGVLAQLCSILDGVDGEIARLRFKESKYGAYLDAILDRYVDFFLVLSLIWVCYTMGTNSSMWIAGSLALMGSPMSMLQLEKIHAVRGYSYNSWREDGWIRFIPDRRDIRLFIIFLGGVTGQILITLWIIGVVTNVKALLRLFRLKKKL
jgi:CDP-L-myo-inositol myo-inositolphosphotransferase